MLLAHLRSLRAAVSTGRVRVVLGSSSPRRRECLCALLGAESAADALEAEPPLFTVLASTFDEKLPRKSSSVVAAAAAAAWTHPPDSAVAAVAGRARTDALALLADHRLHACRRGLRDGGGVLHGHGA